VSVSKGKSYTNLNATLTPYDGPPLTVVD